MGANRRKPYPEIARDRIDSAKLLKKLDDHVDGTCELKQTQIKAAEILLRKVIPDLKSIEHSGELNISKLTDAELDAQIVEAAARVGFVRADPGKLGQ